MQCDAVVANGCRSCASSACVVGRYLIGSCCGALRRARCACPWRASARSARSLGASRCAAAATAPDRSRRRARRARGHIPRRGRRAAHGGTPLIAPGGPARLGTPRLGGRRAERPAPQRPGAMLRAGAQRLIRRRRIASSPRGARRAAAAGWRALGEWRVTGGWQGSSGAAERPGG